MAEVNFMSVSPLDGTHKEWQGLRNLTPHPLRICGPWAPSDGPDFVLEPWGPPLRVPEVEGKEVAVRRGLWARQLAHSMPDLPPKEEGVFWVVSLPVLMFLAAHGLDAHLYGGSGVRSDLLAPDTSKGAIRDEKGNVIGVTGFVQLVHPDTLPRG
jgi:hypothetical protein